MYITINLLSHIPPRAKSSPEMLDLLSSRGGHGSAADADKPHRQRLLLLAAKHDDPETAAECIQYGAVPQGSKANATLSPIHAASMAGSGEGWLIWGGVEGVWDGLGGV